MCQDPDLRQTLLDSMAALGVKDLAAIEQLASSHGLVQIPFLKPNRLVSKREIGDVVLVDDPNGQTEAKVTREPFVDASG